MRKYKLEPTLRMHYLTITDEEGNVFSVIASYNEINHFTNWKITDRYGKDVDDERLREEIIYAISNAEKR